MGEQGLIPAALEHSPQSTAVTPAACLEHPGSPGKCFIFPKDSILFFHCTHPSVLVLDMWPSEQSLRQGLRDCRLRLWNWRNKGLEESAVPLLLGDLSLLFTSPVHVPGMKKFISQAD